MRNSYAVAAVNRLIAARLSTPIFFLNASSLSWYLSMDIFLRRLSRMEAFPKRAVISTLAEAMTTYGAFLNNQWTKALKEETDPFAAVNAALAYMKDCFSIFPPKTVVEAPLQIAECDRYADQRRCC